ncbi:ABC transporter permease [Clostridioides sp. ES-S-0048-02]|uniref:ABC transporter permease n=1 Tax=Clostridioides sp. ES-S-0048-02 TaxID=2770777 RepID=UPI001D10DFBE|nr:ABC transporter permease [Clostridioides sp. ES-S-0048-02]
MENIVKVEFLKLKRYSVIKAGIIMTTLSPLLSLFYSTASGGQSWTFEYFMQQVMTSNCTLFFPIIITLIAGYIITREYTDDTIKNLLTIPIPYKQLLSSKLLVLLLLTIYFSFIGCVIALVINIIARFPGVGFGNIINMFIHIIGANIFVYIAVLPIILLFCCSVNNFLGGVALAFVYGYFGTFEGTLLNYYPIKVSMILMDSNCSAEYGYTYRIFPALIVLLFILLISGIILAGKKKETSVLTITKKKKTARKKGW